MGSDLSSILNPARLTQDAPFPTLMALYHLQVSKSPHLLNDIRTYQHFITGILGLNGKPS